MSPCALLAATLTAIAASPGVVAQPPAPPSSVSPRGVGNSFKETRDDDRGKPKGPTVDQLLARGWSALHDFDHDGGLRSIRAAQLRDPDGPRGFVYEAGSVWLREMERRQELDVTHFIDARHFAKEDDRPRDLEAEERFQRLVDKARSLCAIRLASDPADVDALYLLGVSHAIEAGFLATVRHDARGALTAARAAVREQRRVVTLAPDYGDAYLTLGLYEYTTGSLPFYVKWFAFLAGYRGDKDKGIALLERAAETGQTAKRDAQTMLTVVYVREGRYADALRVLDQLTAAAPHNHVHRINAGYCLMRLGRYFEAADRYEAARMRARRDAKFRRDEVSLLQGEALLHGGVTVQALTIAHNVLADAGLPPRTHSRARLLEARALDVLGRRADAIRLYLQVVRDDQDGDAKDSALELLRTPFAPPGVMPSARAATE